MAAVAVQVSLFNEKRAQQSPAAVIVGVTIQGTLKIHGCFLPLRPARTEVAPPPPKVRSSRPSITLCRQETIEELFQLGRLTLGLQDTGDREDWPFELDQIG